MPELAASTSEATEAHHKIAENRHILLTTWIKYFIVFPSLHFKNSYLDFLKSNYNLLFISA